MPSVVLEPLSLSPLSRGACGPSCLVSFSLSVRLLLRVHVSDARENLQCYGERVYMVRVMTIQGV